MIVHSPQSRKERKDEKQNQGAKDVQEFAYNTLCCCDSEPTSSLQHDVIDIRIQQDQVMIILKQENSLILFLNLLTLFYLRVPCAFAVYVLIGAMP